MSKVFILLGHPDAETLSGAFADAYEEGALSGGHEVRRMNLGEMKFDPILHHGYKTIQQLEPDLLTFQANMKWCDHFMIVYPNWWATMPALLKGLFDRAWLPGFAFRWNKGRMMGWQRLLKGRTARIVISGNTHPWLTWMFFGEFTNELSRAILGFAGFSVSISIFAPSEKVTMTRRGWWIQKVRKLGTKAK